MALALYGLALAALAGAVVWFAAERWWHYPIIAVAWVALFPIIAVRLTGDVSRYLPAGTFSEGGRGKDEIVFASAFATILVAIMLAAIAFWATKTAWRLVRRGRR